MCWFSLSSFFQYIKKAWKDTRSQVFYPLLNILKYKQIPCILLENVQGLVNLKKGQVFNTILTNLEDLNYECFWKVLNCSDYGIPQNRKRLFIVGFHKRILQDSHIFEFPPRLKYTLSELLNKNFNLEIARTIRVGGRGSPLDNRHNWDGYTLFQSTSNSKLTTEYRLSIEDCLLLQNFSKNFQLCGCQTSQYKQIGNTIPTNLSFVLGDSQIFKTKQVFPTNLKKLNNSLQTERCPTQSKEQPEKGQVAHEIKAPYKINDKNYGEIGECIIKAQLLCLQNQHIQTAFGYIQKLEIDFF